MNKNVNKQYNFILDQLTNENHAKIIYKYFEEDYCIIIMPEYIDIDTYIKSFKKTSPNLEFIEKQIMERINNIFNKNMINLDLKSDNFVYDVENERLLIIDFEPSHCINLSNRSNCSVNKFILTFDRNQLLNFKKLLIFLYKAEFYKYHKLFLE